ncbi:Lrp/AsnC family transcriptional regulator [Litoreibacter roseus]|uniref:Transcriptional regulator n=1 Tax=Litoreibacter roseus TaxID=2601869 RepID=A0A6N6JK25_9RHOB|nr:Lrp/AsnC family transcriptional regulator [Litoreibacter roseus]GFE66297.1 transcriptional regulator [Litoreibacter roseus]
MKFTIQDHRLLDEIQRDCTLSLAALAERVGMAQSTVWRRVQDFEAAGIIRGRVALLAPDGVGCKLCVLASIRLEDHSEAAVDGFAQLVTRHPEILECHAISGSADYILKVRVRDVEAYERFMTQNLLRSAFVREVQSSFVLKEIKSTTALPLRLED